jgi:hypothetical protein
LLKYRERLLAAIAAVHRNLQRYMSTDVWPDERTRFSDTDVDGFGGGTELAGVTRGSGDAYVG